MYHVYIFIEYSNVDISPIQLCRLGAVCCTWLTAGGGGFVDMVQHVYLIENVKKYVHNTHNLLTVLLENKFRFQATLVDCTSVRSAWRTEIKLTAPRQNNQQSGGKKTFQSSRIGVK